jgi:hypothetical protein
LWRAVASRDACGTWPSLDPEIKDYAIRGRRAVQLRCGDGIRGADRGGGGLADGPRFGKKTRKRLGRAADDLKESAADRWDEIADDVKDKVDEALATAKKRVR